MSRSRTRTVNHGSSTADTFSEWVSGPTGVFRGWDQPGPFQMSLGGETHTIEDEGGPRRSGTKAVSHVVTSQKLLPFDTTSNEIYAGWWGDRPALYVVRKVGHTYGATPPPSLFSAPSGADKAKFQGGFLSDTLDQVPVQMSVPNFLLEIDEIPKLLDTVKRLRPLGESVRDIFHSFSNKKGRDALVKSTGTWADFHLAYQFGVKPLISDVRNGIDLIGKTDRRIAYLKRTHGKKTKVRRSQGFSNPCSPETSFSPGSPYYTMWGRASSSTLHSAGLTFYQTLGGLDDAQRRMVALSAAAGFNKPLSVVWEAIPFSFLADYFSNIGQVLESYSSYEAFEGKIDVIDGWSSSKTTLRASLTIGVPPSTGGSSFVSTHTVCDYSQVVYSRSPGVTTPSGTLAFDTTTTKAQAENILALARQVFVR